MGTVAVAPLGHGGKPFFEILLWPCLKGGSMKRLFKTLYKLFVFLFWIATFGFGIWETIAVICVCLREFGKALSFALQGVIFFLASVIFVLLGMMIDTLGTKYKIRRW